MKRRLSRSSLAALALLLSACRGGTPPSGPSLTGLTVTPPSATLQVGKTQQLAIGATYSNGSTAVLTTGVAFVSSAPAIATVSDAGLVTAVAAGSTTVTASASGKSATAAISVQAAGPLGQLVVFDDNYGPGVSFNPFGGSTNPPVIDTAEHQAGTASLKVSVPASGYTGGAFKLAPAADLSGFNAVTFWAKASAARTLDTVGLGNDSTHTTYQAEWKVVALTTTWTKYVLPIPLASRLTAEGGAFHYAMGSTPQGAFTFWFDQIQYEKLPSTVLGAPSASIGSETLSKAVGDTFAVDGLSVSFPVNGVAQTVAPAPAYFTFSSTNSAVATVDGAGLVHVAGIGSAVIGASLGSTAASGGITVNVSAGNAPAAAPPAPTAAAGDVISLLTTVYTNVPVDKWRADWTVNVTEADAQVGADAVKKYGFGAGAYVGVEFIAHPIDATQMGAFHLDVWTPDATLLKVKLVDFGPGGVFGGGDDTAAELTFDGSSSPHLATGSWLSLDIPLSRFTAAGLTGTPAHLAQLIFSSAASTVYVDNVYFHKTVVAPPPAVLPVFTDDYASGLSFAPFGGSTNAVSVDTAEHHSGAAALKVVLPASNYTGGALVAATAQDLSSYDALTFWAKASAAATFDKVGFGNDANGEVALSAERAALALTPTWTKFAVPLPFPARLAGGVRGLFHFATGGNAGGVTVWFDDVQYETLGSALGAPQPSIDTATVNKGAGATFAVTGAAVAFSAGGATVPVSAGPGYFTFTSSNTAVATVSPAGIVTAKAAGSADITATLGDSLAAAGRITVQVTGVAPPPAPAVVFDDNYASGVSFAAFGGSANALSVDTAEHHSGTASLKVVLPSSGYTGGALVASAATDLSAYDALTFWAKASATTAFDTAGLGNNATASAPYAAETHALALTSTWTRFVVPIPLPSAFTSITGLFHFATGNQAGVTVWFDDIQYESLGAAALGAPSPAIATESVSHTAGSTFPIDGTSVAWTLSGASTALVVAIPANTAWFTLTSSNTAAVTVDSSKATGTAVAPGTADLTAALGATPAAGKISVTVTANNQPTAAPPAPTAASALSLLTKVYTNHAVDTWLTSWSQAQETDVTVGGDTVKKYFGLNYAGVEFYASGNEIDGTAWSYFHVDVWTPDATSVGIKLVDFGPNAVFAGGDDTEGQVNFNASSTPALVTGQWISLDIPLSAFKTAGLTATPQHLAQLLFIATQNTVYVDNVYFHN